MSRSPVLGVTHSVVRAPMPAGACDSHVHVFGPIDRYPLAADRMYTPAPASLDDLLEAHRQLGIERRIIVHPSVYGSDLSCSVDATLAAGSGTRLVAVIDEQTTDRQLRQLHESGTCGIRINLHTHGRSDVREAARTILWAQDRVKAYGWHLQLFTSVDVIVRIVPELERLELPLVLDHWGKVEAARGADDPEFKALMALLARRPVWVKLSAPERISVRPDFDDVPVLLREFVRHAPERLIWGTDWPHTAMLRGDDARVKVQPYRPVDDGHSLNRLADWLGDAAQFREVLAGNPGRLYGFDR